MMFNARHFFNPFDPTLTYVMKYMSDVESIDNTPPQIIKIIPIITQNKYPLFQISEMLEEDCFLENGNFAGYQT